MGTYRSTGPLAEQLLGEFDRSTAPLTWPAYLFSTVAREDSFTLFFAADHSLLDGYSLILSPYELRELYREAMGGEPARLRAAFADAAHPLAGLLADATSTPMAMAAAGVFGLGGVWCLLPALRAERRRPSLAEAAPAGRAEVRTTE